MKFICLICAEVVMEAMPPDFAEKHFHEYADFTNGIKASGNFVGGNRLTPRETAKTVRVRDGKTLVTDGPFAETREQLGGYYLIEAKDFSEATAIAARIPGARYGSVEVRPIAEDAQTLALGLQETDDGKA